MKTVFSLILTLALFILPVMAEQSIPDQTIIPDGFHSIDIVGGEANDFSVELELNAKTEFEYIFMGYFLPTGLYKVTNIGKYPTQVTIYINDKQKVDGWEEFKVPEEKYPLVIFVGDTKELELAEGEFIKIGEGDTVSFELISLK